MVPQILGYGSKKGFFNDGTPYVPNMKQPIPPKNFEWVDPFGGDRVNSYLRFKVSRSRSRSRSSWRRRRNGCRSQ